MKDKALYIPHFNLMHIILRSSTTLFEAAAPSAQKNLAKLHPAYAQVSAQFAQISAELIKCSAHTLQYRALGGLA